MADILSVSDMMEGASGAPIETYCTCCGPCDLALASYCPHCGKTLEKRRKAAESQMFDFSADRYDAMQDEDEQRTARRVLTVFGIIAGLAAIFGMWGWK